MKVRKRLYVIELVPWRAKDVQHGDNGDCDDLHDEIFRAEDGRYHMPEAHRFENGNSRSAKRATYLEARTKAWGQCRIVPRMLA